MCTSARAGETWLQPMSLHHCLWMTKSLHWVFSCDIIPLTEPALGQVKSNHVVCSYKVSTQPLRQKVFVLVESQP